MGLAGDINDLTQTTLGMSRDDSGSFLPHYAELEIVKKNPFATIDQTGVGLLMEIAIAKGRQTRPDIKLGICGEHGGDPDSVKFCHRAGLTYVSCSPFRVPVARRAAAQAAIAEKRSPAISRRGDWQISANPWQRKTWRSRSPVWPTLSASLPKRISHEARRGLDDEPGPGARFRAGEDPSGHHVVSRLPQFLPADGGRSMWRQGAASGLGVQDGLEGKRGGESRRPCACNWTD